MASFSEISKPTFHLRSNSFPTKSHPLVANIDEQLIKLRSSGSVCQKLSNLKDLFEVVDDLFQLPLVEKAISCNHQGEPVEQMLDGSLRLVDVCSYTRDAFIQMKEYIQELQSFLRRKRTSECSLGNEVKSYLTARKRLSKVISKYFGSLKRTEKYFTSLSSDKDSDLEAAVTMMKEVKKISFLALESLLYSVSQPNPTGWNLVSKLLPTRRVSCEDANLAEEMDAELIVLMGKKVSLDEIKNVLKGLEALESSIQQIEEELECVYRGLLKSRVSLLNMLNH